MTATSILYQSGCRGALMQRMPPGAARAIARADAGSLCSAHRNTAPSRAVSMHMDATSVDEPVDVDVAVIGAGQAGLSAAYHLQRA